MDQRADKSTTTALRKKLRAAGYDPIPVNGKKPHLDAWQTKLAAPDVEIDRWGKAHRHAKTVASASLRQRLQPLAKVNHLTDSTAGDA